MRTFCPKCSKNRSAAGHRSDPLEKLIQSLDVLKESRSAVRRTNTEDIAGKEGQEHAFQQQFDKLTELWSSIFNRVLQL